MSGLVLLGALVAGAIGLFLFVARSLAVHPVSARARAERLVATGSAARALIGAVVPSGSVDNRHSVQCDLHLRVEPLDGSAPFDAVHTVVVGREQLPEVGDAWPCWFDADAGGTAGPVDLVLAHPGDEQPLEVHAA